MQADTVPFMCMTIIMYQFHGLDFPKLISHICHIIHMVEAMLQFLVLWNGIRVCSKTYYNHEFSLDNVYIHAVCVLCTFNVILLCICCTYVLYVKMN